MKLDTRVATIGLGLVLCSGVGSSARELTFDERVRAQEAIERVYHRHQLGSTRSFEETFPRPVLEEKVRNYQRQSAALAIRWKVPVTESMLQRELERMAAGSRMPERLVELYAALRGDAFLIRECLARPALVDRLTRNFFAFDESIHAEAPDRTPKRTWDDWWQTYGPTLDASSPRVAGVEGADRLAADDSVLPRPRLSTTSAGGGEFAGVPGVPDDTWDNGILDDLPSPRYGHSAVWTGTWMIVWGGTPGFQGPVATGGRYDPATDTWLPVSTIGAPSGRQRHLAAWTGDTMIVWGGSAGNGNFPNTGGRYDPSTDTWSPTSNVNAPGVLGAWVWTGTELLVWGGPNAAGRYNPSTDSWAPISVVGAPTAGGVAVWSGVEMIVWGGSKSGLVGTGARYNPGTDTWTSITLTAAPEARRNHTAVWTGTEMLVWSGERASGLRAVRSGGRYDPAKDEWRGISTADAQLFFGMYQSAVWTGGEMIVWGGDTGDPHDTGGRYDPETDTWSATSLVNAPLARDHHTAVWTGSSMIVWGGFNWDQGKSPLNSGGRYDPISDSWTPTSTVGAPEPRDTHTALWTGNEMIVWGGHAFLAEMKIYYDTGGKYDPAIDAWTPTALISAPTPRRRHSAVWTGDEMIVWGGRGQDGSTNSGARYNPRLDRWLPMATTGAPTGREEHTAVWTGTEMIVWAGDPLWPAVPNGGRYDPIEDAWTPMSVAGSPSPYTGHTAVWTGESMIVWGRGGGVVSGGRYHPGTDTWTPVTAIGAPTARSDHSAVWTGNRMLVWGGSGFPSRLASGGSYDPVGDAWTPTAEVDAPIGRSGPVAVWTGKDMLVWGGALGWGISAGGRYDPQSDTWSAMTTLDSPEDRYDATAVWTGCSMLVWGGYAWNDAYFNTGGRYFLDGSADDDGDGFSECRADCNDGDATVFPGGVELPGNFVDEDCDGSLGDCNPCFEWRNHGEYVSCVSGEVRTLVADDKLGEAEGGRLVSEAARSDVGKKGYVPAECGGWMLPDRSGAPGLSR